MSGLEIVGVVLGAFPLAITALDKYREVATRLGLWYKIKLEHKKCRDQLHFHRVTLTSHLRQLLLPLVVDDAMIEKLLSRPGGDEWKDDSIARLLEKRLRDSYQLYLDYIQGMERVMIELCEKLAADSVPVQDHLKSVKAPLDKSRIKHAMTSEGRTFQLYRAKFSNGEAVRSKLFAELEDYNNKLEKLLDSSDKDTKLIQQRMDEARMIGIDMAIGGFWLNAARLFRVLASAWSCCCQELHHGKLQLQHRTTKKSDFNIIFETSASSRWRIRRTRISEGPDAEEAGETAPLQTQEKVSIHEPAHRQDRPIKSAMRKKYQTGPKPLFAAPSIKITSIEPGLQWNTASEIADLCTSLETPDGPCYGYISEDEYRYYVYRSPGPCVRKLSTVTLEQILRGEIRPRPTRKQRYALSLILASSVVQLFDTPWLPEHLKKSDIVFLADEEEPGVYHLDQPHVNRQFASSHSSTTVFGGSNFSWSLDQLGIVLLELCFGEVLEEQPCRKRYPTGDDGIGRALVDVMAARDWQRYVNDEAGPEYAEAVGWCLGGNRSTPSDRWREEMLLRVIQPLQRCSDYLDSGGQPV